MKRQKLTRKAKVAKATKATSPTTATHVAPQVDEGIIDVDEANPQTSDSEESGALEMEIVGNDNTALVVAGNRSLVRYQAEPQVELEHSTFDDEAQEWMGDQDSIPGALSPILYVGWPNCDLIAKGLDRSITLPEAKLLVIPDGEQTECAWNASKGKNVTFQPVRFIAYVPKYLPNLIAQGKSLSEIRFRYGGQYYVEKGKKGFFAVSGSKYHIVPDNNGDREPIVVYNTYSIREQIKKMIGEYGLPLFEVQRIINAKQNREINRLLEKQTLQDFAERIERVNRVTRVGDAFRKAGKLKQKPRW